MTLARLQIASYLTSELKCPRECTIERCGRTAGLGPGTAAGILDPFFHVYPSLFSFFNIDSRSRVPRELFNSTLEKRVRFVPERIAPRTRKDNDWGKNVENTTNPLYPRPKERRNVSKVFLNNERCSIARRHTDKKEY